jgi:hypothetical protein
VWSTLALAPPAAGAEEPPAPALPSQLSIDPPAGWDLLPGLSRKIAVTAEQSDYFGAEACESGALAYGRANQGALYLTWVSTLDSVASPESSVRAALDALHEAPYLASPEAGSTQELAYRERSFDGVAEMSFEWAHMANGTVNLTRTLAWRDHKARVHLASAECVLQSESIGESRPLCEKALASLHLEPAAEPGTLAALPTPRPIGPAARQDFDIPELETPEPGSAPSLNAAPQEPGRVLYQGPQSGADEGSNNRLFIGVGVLLLVVAFWLTTRSRPGDPADSGPTEDADGAGEDAEAGETSEGEEKPE